MQKDYLPNNGVLANLFSRGAKTGRLVASVRQKERTNIVKNILDRLVGEPPEERMPCVKCGRKVFRPKGTQPDTVFCVDCQDGETITVPVVPASAPARNPRPAVPATILDGKKTEGGTTAFINPFIPFPPMLLMLASFGVMFDRQVSIFGKSIPHPILLYAVCPVFIMATIAVLVSLHRNVRKIERQATGTTGCFHRFGVILYALLGVVALFGYVLAIIHMRGML